MIQQLKSLKFIAFLMVLSLVTAVPAVYGQDEGLHEDFDEIFRRGMESHIFADLDNFSMMRQAAIDRTPEDFMDFFGERTDNPAALVAAIRALFDNTELDASTIDVSRQQLLIHTLHNAFQSLDPFSRVSELGEDELQFRASDLFRRRVPGNRSLVYIKIRRFSNGIAQRLSNDMRNWEQNRRIRGVILDLRDNGGGYITEGLSIASMFIRHRPLVEHVPLMKVQTKRGFVDVHVPATSLWPGAAAQICVPAGADLSGAHVIILINENSTSMAETLAGILRSYGKAMIIGTQSFGKGTVQNSYPFSHLGIELTVTVGRVYLPDGSCYDKRGIIPDISLASTSSEEAEETLPNEVMETRTRQYPPSRFHACDATESGIEPFFRGGQESSDIEPLIDIAKTVTIPETVRNQWLGKDDNLPILHARTILNRWLNPPAEKKKSEEKPESREDK